MLACGLAMLSWAFVSNEQQNYGMLLTNAITISLLVSLPETILIQIQVHFNSI